MGDINFGIAGLGGIARRFAGSLTSSEVKGGKLRAAAASSDAEKAKKFASDFGAEKSYGSYAELAADESVDVVYISTTHNFHYENAKLFLNAGKGVICEKPFFLSAKEAEEVIALAKEKNLFLMEAMWTRCVPSFRKAKQWVDEGKIGKVKLIDVSFCFSVGFNPKNRLYDPFTAGGALYDAGVYPIEYVTGIIGEAPETVAALSVAAGTGVDAVTLVNFKFKGGALAQTRCALSCATDNNAFIYGENGKIVTYYFLDAKTTELFDKDGKSVEKFTSDFKDGFNFEINHAIGLLKEGKKESPYIPLSDTLDCAKVFDIVKKQIS